MDDFLVGVLDLLSVELKRFRFLHDLFLSLFSGFLDDTFLLRATAKVQLVHYIVAEDALCSLTILPGVAGLRVRLADVVLEVVELLQPFALVCKEHVFSLLIVVIKHELELAAGYFSAGAISRLP